MKENKDEQKSQQEELNFSLSRNGWMKIFSAQTA
jgi:hypothetical protein